MLQVGGESGVTKRPSLLQRTKARFDENHPFDSGECRRSVVSEGGRSAGKYIRTRSIVAVCVEGIT